MNKIYFFLTFALCAEEKILFDFESGVDQWSSQNIELYKDSTVKIEASDQYTTEGKQSLKLSYRNGIWPTVFSEDIAVPDWSGFSMVKLDVRVERDAVICLRFMQEKSSRAHSWDGYESRFERTAFLKKGANTVLAPLNFKRSQQFRLKNGKVLRFEVALYDPKEGESIYIDNIHLSSEKPQEKDLPLTQIHENLPHRGDVKFKVLGTDLTVKNIAELTQEKPWSKPKSLSVDEVEKAFYQKFLSVKVDHPKAKMVILRDGEKGYDLNDQDKEYLGWTDTYLNCHEPESMLTVTGIINHGKHPKYEMFMRHRVALMKADLSFLPNDIKILSSQLVICRTERLEPSRSHNHPNMWVAEACNRPWVETQANAFQYARYKYWQNYNGRSWAGDDPDSKAVFLAHGPGSGRVNTWDFTHAMKYWLEDKNANHGFWLHGNSKDWLLEAHYRESSEQKMRPAILLIYE